MEYKKLHAMFACIYNAFHLQLPPIVFAESKKAAIYLVQIFHLLEISVGIQPLKRTEFFGLS